MKIFIGAAPAVLAAVAAFSAGALVALVLAGELPFAQF
jgi:hypothetical protein